MNYAIDDRNVEDDFLPRHRELVKYHRPGLTQVTGSQALDQALANLCITWRRCRRTLHWVSVPQPADGANAAFVELHRLRGVEPTSALWCHRVDQESRYPGGSVVN